MGIRLERGDLVQVKGISMGIISFGLAGIIFKISNKENQK